MFSLLFSLLHLICVDLLITTDILFYIVIYYTATVSGTQFGSVEYQNYVAEVCIVCIKWHTGINTTKSVSFYRYIVLYYFIQEQSKDNIKSKIEFYNDLFHEEPRLGMHITGKYINAMIVMKCNNTSFQYLITLFIVILVDTNKNSLMFK